MSNNSGQTRKRLTIAGQVQGVGFRPYVYRLATELQLKGWVTNDARGVTLEIQGALEAMGRFVDRLPVELPPLAKISLLEQADVAPAASDKHFEIRGSVGGEITDAQVTVDTAACEDCLREMSAPADPRHRYPFINCTNCGPRYTIVRRIPYDRPNTTMSEFAMCHLCSREYADPASRRFHAQPIACPQCGPSVWLVDTQGKQIACEDPITTTAAMLLAGKIVAIKGLGGFQIAFRADDDHTVRRLRHRKRRDAKPFALMVADLSAAEALCDVSEAARQLLTGPLRPIVLMPRRREANLASSVAEGFGTLGVMLPYTPLHHLLFDALGEKAPPLVMTSGNFSEEPLVKDNEAAIAHLGQIADALLLHNRKIERRVDDSVVQVAESGRAGVLRRGRGYAPQPIRLAAFGHGRFSDIPPILAVGAELKSAVCLLKSGRAVLGEHVGDLKDGRAYRHFIDTINHLEEFFDINPKLLAVDLHPGYLSSDYAVKRHRGELAGREPVAIVRVQHHHAHAVACMAENGRSEPVVAVVCDGVGYGDDGALWGCEILRADLCGYDRLGHLRYMPLIGGDAASRETYRPAIAALHDAMGDRFLDVLAGLRLPARPEQIIQAMEILQAGVNCPQSSSLGRWFDAVAAMCGIAGENRFEGEAPMKLEAAITPGVTDSYAYKLISSGPFLIDLRPMVEGIVFDLAESVSVGIVAAKFHNTVARFLAAAARRACEKTNLGTVALSGGCFANGYLTDSLCEKLTADGLEVLTHSEIPCNDGGVALGQAVVAAARSQARTEALGGDMQRK